MNIHYLQQDPKGPDGPGLTDTGFVNGYFSCDAGQQWRCKNSRGIFLMPRTRTTTGQMVNQTALQQQPDAALAPGRKEGILEQAPQGPECRAPPHMAVPVSAHSFNKPAFFEPTNKTTMYNNLKDINIMDNNPVFTKLKTEILKEVQPLIDGREQARKRTIDIRKQVDEYRNKAVELKAELRKLDGDYTKALIDSPADAPAIQKKISKSLQAAKDASDAADRLEGQLQPIDNELRNRENSVSVAVSQKVLAASQEYSKLACQHFLDLLGVYLRWIWAVNQLRSDFKVTGLDPLHSHRLHVKKAVQTIPDKDKVLWHRVTKNIASDFGSFGSFFGDI